jgi:hypothetical protein
VKFPKASCRATFQLESSGDTGPEPKWKLVASQDRPFVRDYSSWWRLPELLPPGEAFHQGWFGLAVVLGLVLFASIVALLAEI